MSQPSHQPGTHSDAQAEAIATRSAKAALSEMFAFLGFDLSKAADVSRWHANLQWIEASRLLEEKRKTERWKIWVGALVTAGFGIAVSAGTGVGKLLLAYLGGGAKP